MEGQNGTVTRSPHWRLLRLSPTGKLRETGEPQSLVLWGIGTAEPSSRSCLPPVTDRKPSVAHSAGTHKIKEHGRHVS